MARNRFDVDEELESPFNLENLKKVMVYVARYKWLMISALVLSAVGSVIGLTGPMLIQQAMDIAIPNQDVQLLLRLGGLLAVHLFRTE